MDWNSYFALSRELPKNELRTEEENAKKETNKKDQNA